MTFDRLKMLNPKNYKVAIQIAKISDSLDKHMAKRCKYCDQELPGDFPIVEFVQHLAETHQDKVLPDDLEYYKKMIEKITK